MKILMSRSSGILVFIQAHLGTVVQRPDLVAVNKNTTYKIIDLGVPKDSMIEDKDSKKKEKYQDLVKEFQNIWSWQSSYYI